LLHNEPNVFRMKHTRILTSNMNYFSPGGLVQTSGSDLAALSEAPYEGMQYTPMRYLDSSARPHRMDPELCDRIEGGHQTWFSGDYVQDRIQLRRPWEFQNAVILGSALFTPTASGSLRALQALQSRVARQIPVVLYPTRDNAEIAATRDVFNERIFQPKPDIYSAWSIEPNQAPQKICADIREALHRRGYTGVAFDAFHWRIPDQTHDLPPWEQGIESLFDEIDEFHVSAGRVDYPATSIDTIGELRGLLNGDTNTVLAQMMDRLRQAGWKGRVVVEVPLAGLQKVSGKKLSDNDVLNAHEKIVATVRGSV